MQLNLIPKGDNKWCVHNKDDVHVGNLKRTPDSVKWTLTGKGDSKSEFVAGGIEAALQRVESLFASGAVTPDDTEDRELDNAAFSHYLTLAYASLKLAEGTDTVAAFLRAQLRSVAGVVANVDAKERDQMLALLLKILDEEIEKAVKKRNSMAGIEAFINILKEQFQEKPPNR